MGSTEASSMAASKRDSAIRDVLLAAIGLPFEGWINGVDVQRRHVWKSDWRPRQRARAGRSHRWQVPTGFRTGGAQPGPPVTGPVPKTPRRSSPGRSRFHLHRPPGDERTFFLQPGIRRAVLDRCPRPRQIFEVANIYVYATGLLALQRQYAAWSGLSLLDQSLVGLEHRAAPPSKKTSCLISTRQEFLARHHQCRKPPAVAPIELVAAAV